MTTLESLVLIPPILDCIVTYLYTIELLNWSHTSRTTYESLKSSHAAWRAITFHTPEKPFKIQQDSTSIFSSTLTARRHVSPSGNGTISPGIHHFNNNGIALNPKQKESRCLSIDKTLTIMVKLLPLRLYTSIDLSRTMADKHLIRDLLDNCSGLKWLYLMDCPKLKVWDLCLGIYGLEKRFLKTWKSERLEMEGKCVKEEELYGGDNVSLVAEFMGRIPIQNNIGKDEIDTTQKITNSTTDIGGNKALISRLTHVYTKEVRDGLCRLNEVRDGVRQDILRVMSKLEDVYDYPDLPNVPILGRRPFKLKEIHTDLALRRSTYSGPGWLERLAYSQGDYLFVLCHIMGVKLAYEDC